jgi:hypothetical protein
VNVPRIRSGWFCLGGVVFLAVSVGSGCGAVLIDDPVAGGDPKKVDASGGVLNDEQDMKPP